MIVETHGMKSQNNLKIQLGLKMKEERRKEDAKEK